MDNNDFEQQFTQNLKASSPVPQPMDSGAGKSKIPLIIAIVLGVVVFVESIALIVMAINRVPSSAENEEDFIAEEEELDDAEAASEDQNYLFNDEGSLIAMNISCKSSDGSTITLDTSNNFTATGPLAGTGKYTINSDSLITLSNSDKVLYYDGWFIADGLTTYECEDSLTEE